MSLSLVRDQQPHDSSSSTAWSLKVPTPRSASTRPWTPCSFLLFKDKTQHTPPQKTNRGQKCVSEQQFSNLLLLRTVSQYTDAGEGGIHAAGSPLPGALA